MEVDSSDDLVSTKVSHPSNIRLLLHHRRLQVSQTAVNVTWIDQSGGVSFYLVELWTS